MGNCGKRFFLLVMAALLGCGAVEPASAQTMAVGDSLAGRLDVKVVSRVRAVGAASLSCRIIRPPNLNRPAVRQKIVNFLYEADPLPSRTQTKRQRDGSAVHILDFRKPSVPITITRTYQVETERRSPVPTGWYPFPAPGVWSGGEKYLAGTGHVQVGREPVAGFSRILVQSCNNQNEAVCLILNWIADNIRLDLNADESDALSVMRNRRGSDEGVVHLAVAMLRQVGIPARVVVGLASDEPWRVEENGGRSWAIKAGLGRHCWLEVHYPGYGWVESDVYVSRNFVSPYYVRLGTGLDATGAADGIWNWGGGPEDVQDLREEISIECKSPPVRVKSVQMWERPRSMVLLAESARNSTETREPDYRPEERPRFQAAVLDRAEVLDMPLGEPEDIGFPGFSASNSQFLSRKDGAGVEFQPRLSSVQDADIGPEQMAAQCFVVDFPFEAAEVLLPVRRSAEAKGGVMVRIRRDAGGRPGEVAAVSVCGKAGRDSVTAEENRVRLPLDANGPVLLMPGLYWLCPVAESPGFSWPFTPGNPYGWADDSLITDEHGILAALFSGDFHFGISGRRRIPRHLGEAPEKRN